MTYTASSENEIVTDVVELPAIVNGDTWLGATVDVVDEADAVVDITGARISMRVFKEGPITLDTGITISSDNLLIRITDGENGQFVIGPARILIPDELVGYCKYGVTIQLGRPDDVDTFRRTVLRGGWDILRGTTLTF